MLYHESELHSFLWPDNIPLYGCIPPFVEPCVCLVMDLLATVYDATRNAGVLVSV